MFDFQAHFLRPPRPISRPLAVEDWRPTSSVRTCLLRFLLSSIRFLRHSFHGFAFSPSVCITSSGTYSPRPPPCPAHLSISFVVRCLACGQSSHSDCFSSRLPQAQISAVRGTHTHAAEKRRGMTGIEAALNSQSVTLMVGRVGALSPRRLRILGRRTGRTLSLGVLF